jgi:hypothetical protein
MVMRMGKRGGRHSGPRWQKLGHGLPDIPVLVTLPDGSDAHCIAQGVLVIGLRSRVAGVREK